MEDSGWKTQKSSSSRLSSLVRPGRGSCGKPSLYSADTPPCECSIRSAPASMLAVHPARPALICNTLVSLRQGRLFDATSVRTHPSQGESSELPLCVGCICTGEAPSRPLEPPADHTPRAYAHLEDTPTAAPDSSTRNAAISARDCVPVATFMVRFSDPLGESSTRMMPPSSGAAASSCLCAGFPRGAATEAAQWCHLAGGYAHGNYTNAD